MKDGREGEREEEGEGGESKISVRPGVFVWFFFSPLNIALSFSFCIYTCKHLGK